MTTKIDILGTSLPITAGPKGDAFAWKQFAVISNHLGTPKLLHCPADDDRETATSFSADATGLATLTNHAVTYWIGVEANSKMPRSVLLGDRAAGEVGSCVIAGMGNIVMLRTNGTWESSIHGKTGNAALQDGSAHPLTNEKFQEQLRAVDAPNYNNCAL